MKSPSLQNPATLTFLKSQTRTNPQPSISVSEGTLRYIPSRELMQIEKFISEEKLKHGRLEQQISNLTEQNNRLIKENRRLAHENKTLKSQIGKLSDKMPEMVASTAKNMKKRKLLNVVKVAKLQNI